MDASRSILRFSLAVTFALVAAACGSAPPQPPAAVGDEPAPTGKLPRDVLPLSYVLELEIVPARERFGGRTQIRVDVKRPSARVWLHARKLEVKSARALIGSSAIGASFAQVDDNGLARLDFERELPAGQAVLEIAYDAPFDRQLAGLYKVESGGHAYAFTQFEPVAARQAFPCFDEPAFKTPFDIWLTVAESDKAISNTPELTSESTPAGVRRVHFALTKPLPTYLVAFAVGPLDVVDAAPIAPNAVRTTPLPFRGVAVKGKGEQLRYALERTPPLLDELERYFGIPYPYEKLDVIAVPDFAAGAMENAGAITFREWLLLLDGKTAPEGQRRAFAGVMAHELAHHWFGNLVTMPWWDDIWLNEAFATWMGTRTVAAVHPEQQAEADLRENVLEVMSVDSRVSARRIRQPIDSTHDIANAFDGITYQKGAGVLAMFERWLGAEVFRTGVQGYLRARAFGTATAADLLAALGQASGKDVATPMSSFLDQPGVPFVEVELKCGKQRTDKAEVALKQSRYLPAGSTGSRDQRWQVPVCLRYQMRGQADEVCTLLTEPSATVPLDLAGCPDWLMPNAEGAGYYRFSLDPIALEALRKRGFASLTTTEKLSFADSVQAGFASGALEPDAVLKVLPALATAAERPVALAPTELLRFMREYILDAAGRPALDRFALKQYEPRLRKVGWQERPKDDGDTKLLRAQLIGFLAFTIRDPGARAKLGELGRRYFGVKGAAPQPDAVSPDLRTMALIVAVEEDPALFDEVYQRFVASQDPLERDRLLSALSSVTDDRSARALALTLDPVLRVNEVLVPLRTQVGDERTRAAAWQYLETNFDAIAARVADTRAGGLPALATPFCSKEMAERVQAFFAPRIQKLRGGPRSLAATVEALQLCVAQVELQREGVRAFFAGAR